MADLRFEWDSTKAAANARKHGISFDEAVSAFSDEHGLVLEDPEHSAAEDRFVLLGLSGLLRLLVVVHCYRSTADTIRLISARRATRAERRTYEERWEA
ncbi:MAG TPA: BrnT family toxin [Gemmatimonadales bacterium]|nr:BrnT family toxin [Gemmatimonadales bacterium]